MGACQATYSFQRVFSLPSFLDCLYMHTSGHAILQFSDSSTFVFMNGSGFWRVKLHDRVLWNTSFFVECKFSFCELAPAIALSCTVWTVYWYAWDLYACRSTLSYFDLQWFPFSIDRFCVVAFSVKYMT